MNTFNIIKRNIVSEKSQKLELTGIYTVEADKRATKVDIRNAFSELYGVKVQSVNIIKTREKFKHTNKGIALKKNTITKALIRLKKGERIADFIKVKIKD